MVEGSGDMVEALWIANLLNNLLGWSCQIGHDLPFP